MMEMTEEGQRSQQIEQENLYYAACVNGWIQTRMERDKSLLTLSAAAIPVLMGALSLAAIDTIGEKLLIASSLVSFTTCLFTVVRIFQKNADYFESLAKNETPTPLKHLDGWAFWSFAAGVGFVLILGAHQICQAIF
ncbi:hypothetical protein MAIT1_04536 [Magnetofaba australis IT-1]|uniref:Uncharacterized protein n=2 Tax=Magnetofaba TaxID=1472292 RepID=A0A1Y2K9S1_9PROT|nr:hypothetical protein MAIT1_04536 [Magnetofaba australis IT-1]